MYLYKVVRRLTMNAEFKAFGGKPWGVTDEAFVFNGNKIPYSEMTYFKLITTPTTPLTNGVAQGGYNGKVLTCAFKYADKSAAHQAINFVAEKIEAAHGVVKDYKYKLTAHTGTSLEVYDSYVIINHMQVGSLTTNILRGGALGGKRINFADLTSVQFREPSGMTVGFIQFAYPGSIESKGGITDMINDENSIPIQPSMVAEAREIVKFIETRKAELKNTPQGTIVQQTSQADELKKFKELLDMGVISQEEFDAKKKQILGI